MTVLADVFVKPIAMFCDLPGDDLNFLFWYESLEEVFDDAEGKNVVMLVEGLLEYDDDEFFE